MMLKAVYVTGAFDDLGSRSVRFLDEAARFGDVHVLLWSDETVQAQKGERPKFPQEERLYLLQAIRYVRHVALCQERTDLDTIPAIEGIQPDIWVVDERDDNPSKKEFCNSRGIEYRVLKEAELRAFPAGPFTARTEQSSRTRVIVTGCYDWLHSGHVRFFEEVAELGDLYVVIGHDDNIRVLKGERHPLFPQEERLYMVQAVRFVKAAMIATGNGWLDAEPEMYRIRPAIYAVNEDGDRPEKRQFCQEHGIAYVVLKRAPKAGLPRRESTVLRGF